MTTATIRFGLIFLTLTLTIGVNLPEGFLARLGFDANILMASLLAFAITGLVYHRHIALVVLVVLMVVGANLPAEKIAAVGYESDYLLAALVAIVLMPLIRGL